ncbi:LacI family transcriptional regulator [Nitrospirillum amazonense]|uniref:LacI family transcriptional regulator n=1 Tax=Nitrospirillum amazonense TaxID=28077 RepID=A0A560FFJ8_9PROT|nr:LacI family DNA-binding transcriptional regulator [Nitrospirillum amazonense]TWB20385.1 LacI family transcriptional regulator [Nitrospirillum amazonense]
MGNDARKPTIIDVARVSGVSIKTVSRVLNGEPYVNRATLDKVMKAIHDLGYHPNMSARTLAGKRSYLLGHLYGDPAGPYTMEIQVGLLNRCRARGYHLLIEEIDYRGQDVERRVRAVLDWLRPDGVVLTAPITDEPRVLSVLTESGIPLVRVTAESGGDTFSSVWIDERQAAAALTRHLLSLGHRRIGLIKGPANHGATERRHRGYRDALAELGIAEDPDLIEQGAFTFPSALPCAERLLSLPEPPTAIFACNDEMAAAVIVVAQARGLSLPDDLSVAGFDDCPIASMTWPPLTTVRQPMRKLGEEAADLLISRLMERPRGDATVPHRLVSHDLVVRASTARPKAQSPARRRARKAG